MTDIEDYRNTAPALAQGLGILGEFTRDARALTALELARRLQMPGATVFRLLETLERLGFVQRMPDGSSYRLGRTLLRLGFEYLGSQDMVEHGYPLLDGLRDRTGQSATLVARDGREVVYLARAAAHSPEATEVPLGTRLPAHTTGMGHVLLGDLSLPALRLLYPEARLQVLSAVTPPTVEALFDAARQTRERGWVVAEACFEAQICTVAAPVRGANRSILAAIGVAVQASSLAPELRDTLVAEVSHTAAQLSERLGYVAPSADERRVTLLRRASAAAQDPLPKNDQG